MLGESDEIVAGQRVQIFYENKWYKATYQTVELKPRRYVVVCDVDRAREKPTRCPAHCVTLDMETDLTDMFPPNKSISISMMDAWLENDVMPAVTADVLLQVAYVRLCSKPDDISHVVACLSKMTSLIRTVQIDPSLRRWIGRLSCDQFVLTIGKIAKTSRARRETLIRFFVAGKDILWTAMLDSVLNVFESVTSKNLVDTGSLCHHVLLVLCESFRFASRYEWYERVVRKILTCARDLIKRSQEEDEKQISELQERAFRLLKGFVKVLVQKSSEIRDVVDSMDEKESASLIAWLRSYDEIWASRVNELQSKFQNCTIKYVNRLLHDNGGDMSESERVLESKYARVVDSDEIDTKTRGEKDEEDVTSAGAESDVREDEERKISREDGIEGDDDVFEPPHLVVKSSKQFMSAITSFSGEFQIDESEQKKQDERYEYNDMMRMLHCTMREDLESFTLRKGHEIFFTEFRRSLSTLRKRFATNKIWSQSRASYYVLWDITRILEKIEGRPCRRTRIRVYKQFLNFPKNYDGSSSSDEDVVDIGDSDIFRGAGSQAIVPIDPVATMVFEPDENSIMLVQSVLGGNVDRERIVKALKKSNGNAEMAINYLFE